MTFATRLDPAFRNLHHFAYDTIGMPYRPRVLMRWVYAWAYHLTQDRPPHFAHGVMSAMQVTLFLIVFTSMVALIYATRASITRLTRKNAPVCWVALSVVYMANYQYLLTSDMRAQFPYDVPAVLVFAAAFFALLTNRRWLYYPVFLVGTLNRETTMFLPLLFIILALDEQLPLLQALKRMSVWRYLEAVAQLVVWAGIVHWCNVTTNARLGPDFQFYNNLHFFAQPFHWPTFLSIYGFLWIPYILFFSHIGKVNLQRVALLFPFWFMAMVWKADLLEVRVQSEWIPYLAICLALILRNTLQRRTADPGIEPDLLLG